MRYLAPSAGKENDKVFDWLFRVEKRNRYARVSATRQGPSLKKWREFRRSYKQKVTTV